MQKKIKVRKGKAADWNNIIKLTVIGLLIILYLLFLFGLRDKNITHTIKAQAVKCQTPGGCGGDCVPSQNSGCGYGGCRFWEYCADENNDGVYSCYDTTALGTRQPDFSKACGETKANAQPPVSPQFTPSQSEVSPAITLPPASVFLTSAPSPAQPAKCSNPDGCGGDCVPSQNNGCGYGGCRFWEYCADENRDGVYSCYDTTDFGTQQPDYAKACGDKTRNRPTSIPTPTVTPQTTLVPTSGIISLTPTSNPQNSTTPTLPPSSTPIPNTSPVVPTDTPTPQPQSSGVTRQPDFSKLCMPIEINGSPADKKDMLIIPAGYSDAELESDFFNLALKGYDAVINTNIKTYQNQLQYKMNWYVLNVKHQEFNNSGYNDIAYANDYALEAFGQGAQYCGRDIFMIIVNPDKVPDKGYDGSAFKHVGGAVWTLRPDSRTASTFAHEWAHAAGGLDDEYVPAVGYPTMGANCTDIPAASTPQNDPCVGYWCDPQLMEPYKEPCPAWDCTKRDCSPLARELLQNTMCVPGCGQPQFYRGDGSSLMGYSEETFSGPALLYMIETVFSRYN